MHSHNHHLIKTAAFIISIWKVCERIAGEGLVPVPHVAARSLRDKVSKNIAALICLTYRLTSPFHWIPQDHLEEYISKLVARASVEEVGNRIQSSHVFNATIQIIQSIQHGF